MISVKKLSVLPYEEIECHIVKYCREVQRFCREANVLSKTMAKK